eukprot:GFUD01038132.1.p1 GENE.GFUD01038132.1~~GFUD01038132.1.p1  ORF type:complete len:350 (-),score=91.30 GFUD01038132.1:64-1113(-)
MEIAWSDVEDNEKIKEEFSGYRHGLVWVTPGHWAVKPETAHMLPTYNKMSVRPSDAWVVTYPKCGTTWMQELVWQVANKVDIKGGKADLNDRFPFLELDSCTDIPWVFPGILGRIKSWGFSLLMWWSGLKWNNPRSWLGYNSFAEIIEAKPESERRFIKSHLALSLLPEDLVSTAKVIYVARSPKDVMVSYYHHHKDILNHGYNGDLPNFAKRFIDNQLMFGPYFPHIEEGWALRDHPNFLFIFYEDMKRDIRSVIAKVSKLLDSPLTDDQVETLVEHLDIKNFRNNPAVNMESAKMVGMMKKEGNFIRKGAVGGWKEEFEEFPELENIFHTWVEDNMATSNVVFPIVQ